MKALVLIALLAACSDERDLGGACTTDCTARVHPAGILDPASDDWHGKELARRGYDFGVCARCHGADFTGGAAKVSCVSCHSEGPTACTTCHGTGPKSNAHPAHAAGAVTCSECHTLPTRGDDGHQTGPVAIAFGARANTTIDPADRAGPASWDGATCTNVYCHGAALHAAGGAASAPRWDDSTPAGGCDRCHGNPPPSHARSDCKSCHPANAPHIDGAVQIGRTQGCSGCHGGPTSPAPPTDLAGNTFTTAIGVGAHQAHLQGSRRLTAPIACATCHLVPATLNAPGHIDSAGPAEVVAALGWDRTTQTCTAWCHGPSRPVWTSTGQVACGTCHGIPPTDANHSPAMPLASCATCHPGTVDAFGNILVTGGASEHINGVVDLQ